MEDEEGIQIVFRRLDPLIQTLLPLIARFQGILVESGHKDSSVIQLIQSQIQILQNFEDVVNQLGPSAAPALVVLGDYISLPLNSILHVSAPFASAAGPELGQQGRIFVSHVRRLMQSASRAIQIYVESSCSNDMHGSSSSIQLKDTHIINFLVAVVSVLPVPITNFDGRDLDKSLDLFITLSGAIKALIHVCPGLSLYDKWNGDLVVKVVDFSTFFALVENDHLNLLSLDILDGLMIKVERSQFWQRIFPGIFASIYRRLITSGLRTSAGVSIKIQANGLKVIGELIKVSMPSWIEKGSTRDTSILHKSQLFAHIPTVGGAIQTSTKTEKNFLLELRNRVSSPLSYLMRHFVQSPSENVRIQLAVLCEKLFDSWDCWQSTSLLEHSFEICLILQSEDPSEAVSIRTKSVISAFQNSKHDKSWMIPRIESLAGETLSMANCHKHAEMRTHLQLLMGYIRCLGSDGSVALSVSISMRGFLVALGDVDIESLSPQPVEKVGNGRESIRLRHFSKDTGMLFRKMLRHLGATIGWKHGSRLIDMLLSDFCERSFDHLACTEYFEDDHFHKNVGALVVCDELIRGAFATGQGVSRKKERRSRESLLALASSCLPLFIDASMWKIRTIEGSEPPLHPGAPAQRAYRRNACVIVLVLKLASTFFDVLGGDSAKLVHLMLCPVIEKASQRNHGMVNATAKDAAISLAKACGLKTLSDLFQQNLSTVLVGLRTRFQSPLCPTTQYESFLRDAMKTLQWIFLHTIPSKEGTRVLADLLSFLEGKIDRLAIHNHLSTHGFQDLVALHETYIEHLDSSFSEDDYELAHSSTTFNQTSRPWLDVLSVYENSSQSIFQRTSETEEVRPLQDSEVCLDDFHLISKIFSRENYILSNCTLVLQVSACRALSSAYRALAHFPTGSQTGDTNSVVENAILKQAATSWPSTKARLTGLAENVLKSRKVDFSFMTSEPQIASQADLDNSLCSLGALIDLISTICECCGSFMSTRFSNDVWPVVARYLGFIIQCQRLRSATDLNEESIVGETAFDVSDSERQLIVSMLDCLCRVYPILNLSDDILSAGAATLLPFLDTRYVGPILAEKAMQAIKRLADANCDELWRPLLQLMGSEIPPFPIGSTVLSRLITSGTQSRSPDTRLPQKAAAELLIYINGLTEQDIS